LRYRILGLRCITRRRPYAQDAIAHARTGYRGSDCGWYVQTNVLQEVRKKDKAKLKLGPRVSSEMSGANWQQIFNQGKLSARG
jgi:hypothetical protein